MKYRKRPVVIEAEQWDGTMEKALHIVRWIVREGGTATHVRQGGDERPVIMISTLEGNMSASPGDYIIRGVKGEFYPCREDIFLETYEQAVG